MMDRLTTSRRALLGALAIAAPAAAVAAPFGLTCVASADRTGWDSAFVIYSQAKRVSDDYLANVWRPASATVDKITPRPKLSFTIPATSGQQATFDMWPGKMDEWDNHCSPLFRDAAAKVKARWNAHQEARQHVGMDTIDDECDHLANAEGDALFVLLMTPAPDVAALRWKIEYLFSGEAREDGDECPAWNGEWMDAFMADTRRLLAGGQA